MRTNRGLKLVTCLIAALALPLNQFELNALAQPPENAGSNLVSRPPNLVLHLQLPANARQNPSIPTVPTVRSTAVPAPAAKNRSALKWVLIAAAGTGVVVAFGLTKRNSSTLSFSSAPSVMPVVRPPVIGQPNPVGPTDSCAGCWDY